MSLTVLPQDLPHLPDKIWPQVRGNLGDVYPGWSSGGASSPHNSAAGGKGCAGYWSKADDACFSPD
jgi:hypothetical protein